MPDSPTRALPARGAVGDVAGASPRAAASLRSPGAVQRILAGRVSPACATRCQAAARGCLVRKRVLVVRGLPKRGPPLHQRDRERAIIPEELSQRLMHYQRVGVRWLFAAWARGGGILADDPGLGKTVQVRLADSPCGTPCSFDLTACGSSWQTIALLLSLVDARKAARILLVVPPNNVGIWELEFR